MLVHKKSIIRLSYILWVFSIFLISIILYRSNSIYDNLSINYDNKNVKYGNKITADDIVKTSNAPYKIIKDIDTSKLGEQEILVEITKEDVSKIIPINVLVVDETKPDIKIKEENVSITVGDEFDVKSNIESVIDDSTELKYLDQAGDNSKEYYTVNSSVNNNEAGTYEVEVTAVDRANNKTVIKYNVEVKNKVVAPAVTQNNVQNRVDVNANAPINPSGNDLVSIALSLVGSPYRSGGNQPGGFDCSGFVQYVYSRVGKYVSRSSYTQAYDGVAVSYANAQPGDILNFGHGGRVTHSALYIGNGQMVHATNPSMGVVVSNVAGWENGSADTVLGVRRVN